MILGGSSFGPVPDNFGPLRGRQFGHEGRGGRGGGGGGGFRGDMVEPAWDEEPLPPPRWRHQQDDWPEREPPSSRHWDRERDRDRDRDIPARGGRGGDWSSPRRPPPPPLPPRNERGSHRDRYGGRGDRGSDRRRSGSDRDRDQPPPPPPPRERERRTSERRSGRWSDRKSPDPSQSTGNSQSVPATAPIPAPPAENEVVPNENPSTNSVNAGQQNETALIAHPTSLHHQESRAVSSPPPAPNASHHKSPLPPASSPPQPPTFSVSEHADDDLTAPGTEEDPPSTDAVVPADD